MTKASNFEIEIKSLLGSKDNADRLVEQMRAKDKNFRTIDTHKQLNHYFIDGDLKKVAKSISKFLNDTQNKELGEIVERAQTYSLRTRLADEKVIFVLKAAVDDTTSANGTARREFEAEIKNLGLEDLDKLILDGGFRYQSKWSRERQAFKYKNMDVTVDKNAGYGYLAEFERGLETPDLAEQTKSEIRELMKELDARELQQDRLERMFEFYNKNWPDYYGTDKTFVVE